MTDAIDELKEKKKKEILEHPNYSDDQKQQLCALVDSGVFPKLFSKNDSEESTETKEDSETEQAKAMLESMREKLSLRAEQLGIPLEVNQLRTMKDIDTWVDALKKIEEKSSHVPSGTAPLNDAQLGIRRSQATETLVNSEDSVYSMVFEDREDMIRVVSERAKKGDLEAQKVLTQLVKKIPKVSAEYELVTPVSEMQKRDVKLEVLPDGSITTTKQSKKAKPKWRRVK